MLKISVMKSHNKRRLTSHQEQDGVSVKILNATIMAVIALLSTTACSKPEPPPPAPPAVTVASVVQKDTPISIELVGAMLGSEDVEIRSRVGGYLVSMNFTEGTFVR